MIFGYVRISTTKEKQKTDRQDITLENYSKENNFQFDDIIKEKITGSIKAENRSKYKLLKEKLRKGDILIVTDVDRLGRDADDVIIQFKTLKSEGIRVIPLDTPYLNEWKNIQDDSMYNMIADIFITLKAHQAQQEREKIISRINQGLEAARKKGTKLGRPPVEIDSNFIREYTKFKNGDYGKITATKFAKMLGIGRSTLYKYINLLKDNQISD